MDMRKIGAFISELRKNKDYTQVELAIHLNVSHQAVSKWERGESLPDIGLLPSLANRLDITIDELLNGGSANLAISTSPSTEEGETKTRASYTQQSSTNFHDDEQTNQIALEHIISLAPFLSKETLESMLDGIDIGLNMHMLNGLAPFVGRAALERLVVMLPEDEIDIRAIAGLAPFLGTECLGRLADHASAENIDWNVVQALSPFLEASTLSRVVSKISPTALPDASILVGLAPFLDQTDLVVLIEQLDREGLLPVHVSGMAPFLPTDFLNTLILRFKVNAN